jgi:hypothetical protein
LEQRIVPQLLSVVAIGLTGQDLIDFLGEQSFACVGDEFLRPQIGQSLGKGAQDTQLFVEQAQGQQSSIGDDAATGKIDGYLLRPQVPEGKLLRTVCRHDLEPPRCYKSCVSCNLHTTGGSFFKSTVRDPG